MGFLINDCMNEVINPFVGSQSFEFEEPELSSGPENRQDVFLLFKGNLKNDLLFLS